MLVSRARLSTVAMVALFAPLVCSFVAPSSLGFMSKTLPSTSRVSRLAFGKTAITATVSPTKPSDPLASSGKANLEMRKKMEKMLREVQDHVCKSVEEVDGGAKFRRDEWSREDGGGGVSAVMGGGKVWEKAGCNLAVVHGSITLEALYAANDLLKGSPKVADIKPGDKIPFFACGLSSVMHPRNPHCPTMHFNYRYFEAGNIWWFGGGTDITPIYIDEADMKHFHGTYKKVCDNHDPTFYSKFKKWADEYFTITHRGETRGFGGIFFDDLNDRPVEKIFEFCKEAGMAVPEAYLPIIKKHKNDAFTEEQKRWQLIRRGRYAEFNLIYDRGTIFGLKTGGRVESILMTIPETARWEYDHHPVAGSPEAAAMEVFKHPREWL